MPRQIIDTESSRPAYNRRRLRRLIVAVLPSPCSQPAHGSLLTRRTARKLRALREPSGCKMLV